MPFHRFENYKVHHLNPHLSTGEGPVIEGAYMYFRIVTKKAGTGSTLHYHPNELMAFPLKGKINAVVGRERRIVKPGTFVHMPPYARHGFTACEDGDLTYLYIKDRTWTLIGSAEDEALPDEARSAHNGGVELGEFSVGDIVFYDRHAAKRAARRFHRSKHHRVVQAIHTGLHQHRALHAQCREHLAVCVEQTIEGVYTRAGEYAYCAMGPRMCACVSQASLGSVSLGLRGLKSGGAQGGAPVVAVLIVKFVFSGIYSARA